MHIFFEERTYEMRCHTSIWTRLSS